jgi:hypothetical protein
MIQPQMANHLPHYNLAAALRGERLARRPRGCMGWRPVAQGGRAVGGKGRAFPDRCRCGVPCWPNRSSIFTLPDGCR